MDLKKLVGKTAILGAAVLVFVLLPANMGFDLLTGEIPRFLEVSLNVGMAILSAVGLVAIAFALFAAWRELS